MTFVLRSRPPLSPNRRCSPLPSPPAARRIFPGQRGGIIFRLIFLLALCFCLVFLYLLRHPLLRLAGAFWIVDDALQRSDAIVVLGDDNYYADRAAHAAELYRAGWAPKIVVSGRYLRPYASVADLMQHDLTQRGVPPTALLQSVHRARNTREEAATLAQLFLQQGWKRITVITSNYHTRRTRYICARVFPPGTDLRVSAAPDSEYDPRSWWTARLSQKLFFHELVGMLVAMWELRHQPPQTAHSALDSFLAHAKAARPPFHYATVAASL